MLKKEYPILEFDGVSENYVPIKKNITTAILPECCVLTFFGDAVQDLVAEQNCEVIGELKLETFVLPIYAITGEDGRKVALVHAFGGGPYAAGQLEKLTAMGCKKFIVCGGCGALLPDMQCGELLLPTSAVRDEGTSYHYVAPAREIQMQDEVKTRLCQFLDERDMQYRCVKTWTTDAMYRETVDLIELRRQEGCSVVEMECASFYAVAQYKNVALGVLLYAGDDLSKKTWDSRNWKSAKDVRANLLKIAIEACLQI